MRLAGRRRLVLVLDNGGGNKCGVLASFLSALIHARVLDHAIIAWWYPNHGKGPSDRYFGAVQHAFDNVNSVWSVGECAHVINGAPTSNGTRFDPLCFSPRVHSPIP